MDEPRYEEIRPRTRRLGRVLVHRASVGSTMDEARATAEAGEAEGFVVVADEQTAGLGRHGRSWHSPPGNLHATILLRPAVGPERATWIPLLAGLSLSEAMERLLRLKAWLKWPNDVLIGARKVAGILTDARWGPGGTAEWVLLGLGVNGDRRVEEFPPELRASATSLSIETGRHVCLPALLKIFLERLEENLVAVDGSPDELRRRVAPRMATLGRRVRIERSHGVLEGLAVGLGDRGDLVVAVDGVEVVVDSGDCQHLRTE